MVEWLKTRLDKGMFLNSNFGVHPGVKKIFSAKPSLREIFRPLKVDSE